MPDVLKEWMPVAPLLLVIVGWWIANRQANARERRKELRAEVDRFSALVREIVQKNAEYRRSSCDRTSIIETTFIKAGLQRLAGQLERNSGRLGLIATTAVLAQFFDCVSGDDFESSPTGKIDPDLAISQAAAYAETLINAIESAFISKYP